MTPAVFHILLSLVDGERHGYGVMKEVEARTEGGVRLGPGTLYRSVKQMLADGLIVEADERADPGLGDRQRRYYRITERGRRVLGAEARRLEALVGLAREKRVLGGLIPERGLGT